MSSTASARLSLSPAQPWRQVLLYNVRTASTFSVEEVGGNGKLAESYEPENPHRSLGNSNFKSPGKPGTRSHVGISGSDYGRNEAGAAHRGASLDSARLRQAHNVRAMRNASDNAQENHFKYGTNAGVNIPESMALPLEKDLTMPDAASANASAPNPMPSKSPFAATKQRPEVVTLEQHSITSLVREYHVFKVRTHATLWHQELRKQAGDLEGNADLSMNGKDTSGVGDKITVPLDWESFDPPEGEIYDEGPAKEEALMFEEFEKRRERNRIQIASFVKQHLYGRRRPVDGWKYIINNFGADDKATKVSAFRGRQTTGNDLEKLALKRESTQLRKKA